MQANQILLGKAFITH